MRTPIGKKALEPKKVNVQAGVQGRRSKNEPRRAWESARPLENTHLGTLTGIMAPGFFFD